MAISIANRVSALPKNPTLRQLGLTPALSHMALVPGTARVLPRGWFLMRWGVAPPAPPQPRHYSDSSLRLLLGLLLAPVWREQLCS